jgi:hypothetical protein
MPGLTEHLSMDIRPLFSEDQWPRLESRIRESMAEFARRRLLPPRERSAQYLDSSGNHTSSVAQRIMDQRSTLPTPMPQNTPHDPTRVQGGGFAPSEHPAGFSFGDEMPLLNYVQQSGRGNETIDSACYATFDPTNVSSHTVTGFPGDKPVATDDCVFPEATLLPASQGFEPLDNISGLPSDSEEIGVYLDWPGLEQHFGFAQPQ